MRAGKTCCADKRSVEIEDPLVSKFADGGSSDILTDTAPAIRLPATETQQDHTVSLAGLVGDRVFQGANDVERAR